MAYKHISVSICIHRKIKIFKNPHNIDRLNLSPHTAVFAREVPLWKHLDCQIYLVYCSLSREAGQSNWCQTVQQRQSWKCSAPQQWCIIYKIIGFINTPLSILKGNIYYFLTVSIICFFFFFNCLLWFPGRLKEHLRLPWHFYHYIAHCSGLF